MPKTKLQWRQALRSARDSLPAQKRAAFSKAIAQIFVEGFAVRFAKAPEASPDAPMPNVALYASMGSEVATGELITRLKAQGTKTYLPRCVAESGLLEFVEVGPDTPMRPGPHGTYEPVGQSIEPTALDVVVMPGLGFTAEGVRLGYGGGYYDRTLAKCRRPTVALAYQQQIVSQLPRQPHDCLVDAIVSEKGWITVRPFVKEGTR